MTGLEWDREETLCLTHTDHEPRTVQSVDHHHTGYVMLDLFIANWASVELLSKTLCRKVSNSDKYDTDVC